MRRSRPRNPGGTRRAIRSGGNRGEGFNPAMLTTRTAQFTGLAMAAWGIATATVASIGVEWLRRNHTPPPVIVPAQRKTGELRAVGGRAKRSTR